MPVNSGLLKRLQVDGVDFDPVGDWTIKERRIKLEHKESTHKDDYLSETVVPGSLSGNVAIRDDQDADILTNARFVNVIAVTPADITYRGTMSYTADAENAINDGQLQVELTGRLKKM